MITSLLYGVVGFTVGASMVAMAMGGALCRDSGREPPDNSQTPE